MSTPIPEIVKVTIPAAGFKLLGPVVAAKDVVLSVDTFITRLEEVRVNTLAYEESKLECLTGDPGVDKVMYLLLGALKQLNLTCTDYQIIQKKPDLMKVKALNLDHLSAPS